MKKENNYHYIKYLIKNIRLRKGTKIPLVHRDPYELKLKIPKKQKHNEHISDIALDEFFMNKHIDSSLEQNEQIKSIINTLKSIPEEQPQKLIKSRSFITGIQLPKLSRNKNDSSLKINTITDRDKMCMSPFQNSTKHINENKSTKSLKTKKKVFRLFTAIVIKSFYVRSKPSEHLHPKQMDLLLNKTSKPINKDAFITKVDFTSKTFGNISLFGLLHGIGENGHIVSKYVRNFIINYFSKCDIETSLNKDNYYTILSNVFLNANSYIKNTLSSKYNLDHSGTTCQLLFFPNDNTQNIYCTNAGNSKTILYSYTDSIPLSYEHIPSRICESDYILKEGKNVKIINKERSIIVKVNEDSKGGFPLSRVLGCFYWNSAGVTANPEVIECNLNREGAKVIVMGTEAFWKYMSKETVGEIVIRHYNDGSVYAACKELEESARVKWRKCNRDIDDITVIVIFLKREKQTG